VVPRRGQHDAGQDRKPCTPGAGQVGGLGADERFVDGTVIAQVDEILTSESSGERRHAGMVQPGTWSPVVTRLQHAGLRRRALRRVTALAVRERAQRS
jgi:hypothetical protein